jgi:hypothetical protein
VTEQRWRDYLGNSGTAGDLVVLVIVLTGVLGWPWLLWSHSGHLYAWAVVGVLWDAVAGSLVAAGLHKYLK